MPGTKDAAVARVKKTTTNPTKPPTTAQKPNAKPNAKSEEFVVDSDDDDEEMNGAPDAIAATPKTTSKRVQKNVIKPNGVGDTSKRAAVQPVSSSEASDESSEEESDEEEESSADAGRSLSTSGSKKATGGVATAAVESSVSEESSEGDDDDSEEAVGQQLPELAELSKSAGPGKSQSTIHKNGVAAADEMDVDTDPEQAQPPQSRAAEVHTSEARPVQPFQPPPDFRAVTMILPSAAISNIKSSTAAGHQIWHITAPKGVPVSQIKELALQNITNGDVALAHNGTDYAFSAVGPSKNGATALLLPSADGYKPVSTVVSRTLHLEQVVKLPRLSDKQSDPLRGSDAAASTQASALKRKREQPKGLKQRFVPIGVVKSYEEEAASDAEMAEPEQRTVAFRAPPAPLSNAEAAQSKQKKRKEGETDEERAARKAAKKAKKEAKAATASSSQMDDSQTAPEGGKVKKKKKSSQAVEAG